MSVSRPEPFSGSHPSHVSPAQGSPAQGSLARVTPVPSIFCFSIQAQADPGVMPRVLELFAKRNLVPVRWHSDVLAAPNLAVPNLAIDVQVEDVSTELGNYIARCLRQIPGVATVLTAEKRPAAGRVSGALSA
jgi:hypothetical protein